MECRSCLDDPTVHIIADASVAINLNATGHSEAILDALPNRFLIVEEVVLELEDGRRNARKDADALSALIASSRIEVVRLGDIGARQFIGVVSGSAAETLDDGEAATIAYALEQDATALIDERKANRICASRFAELSRGCTVDLLAHDNIQASLGCEGLAAAVFNALYYGRMRVLAHHAEWVVNLIGPERAAQCSSLPKSVRPVRASLAG